jgi:cytochrome P450
MPEENEHMTNRPPGPKGDPIWGARNEFRDHPLEFLLEASRYGDVSGWRFGPIPIFQINQPDLIHQVYVSDADKFYKTTGSKEALGVALGNGLLTSDGDFWKRQRRLVQPAFHAQRITAYGDLMVQYTRRMLAGWQAGQTRDVHADMMRLTLEIVAKALFDTDIAGDVERIGQAMHIGQENTFQRINTFVRLPVWFPTPRLRRGRAALKVLDEVVWGIINERRKSGEDRGDLMSMLLLATDDEGDGTGMTDKQVRDETLTLLLAGHDTTANTLTWAWYLLSQHPDVRQKLLAELDTVLAGRDPTVADLPKLVYTEQIIRETMRLYPAAWVTVREPQSPVNIGGYDLPRRYSVALVSAWSVHRDPCIWEEPERFDPQRFAPGWEDRIHRYAYIPFGGGPRVCIGNAFSLMEARLLLATIAQTVSLSLPAGQSVEPHAQITLSPKGGLPMLIGPRGAEKIGVAA